jgi:pimeloyl-ACP methyl ester carboxylesterase
MRLWTIAAAVVAASPLAFAPVTVHAAAPTAETPRERMSVVVEGRGPDVILVPGLASSREVWSDLAARLRRTHRVHLVQIAGFAGVPAGPAANGKVAAPVADAIADYIRRERLKGPTVIGHSLGGEVGLMLAARYPGSVGRLMIVDALPFYSLLFDPAATVEKVEARAVAFRDAMIGASVQQAEAMQAAAIARLVRSEAARPALVEMSRRSDRAVVANAAFELMTTDLRPELGRIGVPVEVVYAYHAEYGVPPTATDTLFRNAYSGLAGARFRRIDDSYHFVMLDRPEPFAAAVAAFLAE